MERPVTQRTLPAKPIQFRTSERRANMDTTEPRGSDAEIVALLQACGMEEANLDDGVRRVRELLEAKKDDAATYAATLDLEAMETRVQYFGGPLRHDVTKLIAEVRRLREDVGDAWEYGIRTGSFINHVYDWYPWTREEVMAECKRRNDHDGRAGYSMTSVPFRRKAAGEPEALA